ncbi:Ribonuclease H-like superfamily protein [Rhynchospora pubera]|uniref:Ribonuclease H-like superfamily protein n=1 Tax=Rhynchospora pubera TaxID=906938 RepID=A0AAV8GG92_9POAL|nr:Ribonuclease H-like superfamily protein [Rhynchospora pubera]
MTLKDLTDNATGRWNVSKLITAFGFHGALFLAITFPDGPLLNDRQDRLVFTATNNGAFSLKSAYRLLSTEHQQASQPAQLSKEVLNTIWHNTGLLPKVRLFLWKLVKHALPVDHLLATRLRRQKHGCSLCGDPNEDVTHVIFKCHLARRVWLTSSLGIRTDALPNDTAAVMAQVTAHLDEQQLQLFASLAWNIWKHRCKVVYEGGTFDFRRVLSMAGHMLQNVNMASSLYSNRYKQPTRSLLVQDYDFTGFVDGSWVSTGKGGSGWAYVLIDKMGNLIEFACGDEASASPIHSETLALKHAINAAKRHRFTSCSFLTDCTLLHQVMLCNPLILRSGHMLQNVLTPLHQVMVLPNSLELEGSQC